MEPRLARKQNRMQSSSVFTDSASVFPGAERPAVEGAEAAAHHAAGGRGGLAAGHHAAAGAAPGRSAAGERAAE